MALVNFHRLNAAAYGGIETKQPDTIYFVTDARRIYMGEKEYGLQVVSGTRPGTGSLNTLYIDPTAHTISYWNGTSYDALEIPFGTSISGAGDDAHLATTKAVVDYVASQVAGLDVGALKGRVDTLEGEMDAAQVSITTITGEGEGSIKKAASDTLTSAKSYTDQEVAKKANLKHTHEITDVNGLQDALDGKANTVHTHTTAQVDGLDAALSGKADKSTTLAGYGIGDAYTKGQTDSAIATAVAAAPHLKRSIVEELPDAGSADQNTIYMVGTGAGSEDSAYEEYMVINGAFEGPTVLITSGVHGGEYPGIQTAIELSNELDFVLICMPEREPTLRYSEVIQQVMEAIILDELNDPAFAMNLLEQISKLPKGQ